MACEKDYSKGIIYTIRTNDGLYVGSTVDFKDRKRSHKCCIYNENRHEHNYKLYKNIRANDGEYCIEMYKPFPCNSKRELEQEEDKVMLEMNANLNERRAYISEEEKRKISNEKAKIYYQQNKDEISLKDKLYHQKNREEILKKMKLYKVNNKEKLKLYYEKNKDKANARQREKITCECGCDSTRVNISSHRKTKKHLKLMKELDEKKQI